MKKIWLVLIVIFLVACTKTDIPQITGNVVKEQVKEVCKDPYFEFKANECCLDKNKNRLCDTHEGEVREEVKEIKPIVDPFQVKMNKLKTTLKEKNISLIYEDYDTNDEGLKTLKLGIDADRNGVNTAVVREVFIALYRNVLNEADYFIVFTDNKNTRLSAAREVCSFKVYQKDLVLALESKKRFGSEWMDILDHPVCINPN